MDAIGKALDAADRSYIAAKASVESRASRALTSSPGGVYSQPSSLSKASEQYRHNLGWVFCCVRAISQKIAGQDVYVGRVGKPTGKKLSLPRHLKAVGDNIEPLPTHPILDLLDDPNPITTRWALLYSAAANLLVTGRSFLWLPMEGKRRECWPIPTSWVTPIDILEGRWRIRPKNATGEGFEVGNDSLVHLSLPDPSDPLGGALSPVQAQATAIACDEAQENAQYRSAKQGINPSAIVRVGRQPNMLGTGEGVRPVLTEDQKHEIRDALQSHTGPINRGGVLFVDGLIEGYDRFSLTPQELDFLASGQITKARIFQAFGVSPFALGQVENGNRAAMLVAQATLSENVLNPLAELFSQGLTAWLAPMFGEPGLKIWLAPFTVNDDEMSLKQWEVAMRYGAVRKNEYRKTVLNIAEDPEFDRPVDVVGGMLGRAMAQSVIAETEPTPKIMSWEWDRGGVDPALAGNGRAAGAVRLP